MNTEKCSDQEISCSFDGLHEKCEGVYEQWSTAIFFNVYIWNLFCSSSPSDCSRRSWKSLRHWAWHFLFIHLTQSRTQPAPNSAYQHKSSGFHLKVGLISVGAFLCLLTVCSTAFWILAKKLNCISTAQLPVLFKPATVNSPVSFTVGIHLRGAFEKIAICTTITITLLDLVSFLPTSLLCPAFLDLPLPACSPHPQLLQAGTSP